MSKKDKELRQQVACEWLEQNYLNWGHLRHDIVTDRLQIRVANLESSGGQEFRSSYLGKASNEYLLMQMVLSRESTGPLGNIN